MIVREPLVIWVGAGLAEQFAQNASIIYTRHKERRIFGRKIIASLEPFSGASGNAAS
jgi:hypothetical protein